MKKAAPFLSSVTRCDTKRMMRPSAGRPARRRASLRSVGQNTRVSMVLGMDVMRCPVIRALCLAWSSNHLLHVTKWMLEEWYSRFFLSHIFFERSFIEPPPGSR